METVSKTSIIPARENHFIQKNFLNKAPVRWIVIAINTNSTFTGSFTENPFWYRHFDLRKKNRILREGQPVLDFGSADVCRRYATTVKSGHFQDEIPSIPIDNLKDHYVQLIDWTSLQDGTEKCHYPEQVAEPLGLELNSIFTLEHHTLLIVLIERMS